ncbi:natriuretic peptides A-like [Liasis olivaceus]
MPTFVLYLGVHFRRALPGSCNVFQCAINIHAKNFIHVTVKYTRFCHLSNSFPGPLFAFPLKPKLDLQNNSHVTQHLLDRLREKLQRAELELADYEAGGANDDDSYPDLGDSEMAPSQEPKLQDPLFQGEMEAQWRKFLVASRRYFSGCFGIRLDRIGTQTGLGCKAYKPRSWRRPRS